MLIGSNITKFRILSNLNKNQLAKLIGVSRSYVSQIESDKKTPSTEIIQKIAKALNTTTSELLGEMKEELQFVKENIDLIRGEKTYEEMSKNIGEKLNEPQFSKVFDAQYLKDIAKGNAIPDENQIRTLSKFAQVSTDFFYKNNTIDGMIIEQKKFKKLQADNKSIIEEKGLNHLDGELLEFVIDPKNKDYLLFAKQIKDRGIKLKDILGLNLKIK